MSINSLLSWVYHFRTDITTCAQPVLTGQDKVCNVMQGKITQSLPFPFILSSFSSLSDWISSELLPCGSQNLLLAVDRRALHSQCVATGLFCSEEERPAGFCLWMSDPWMYFAEPGIGIRPLLSHQSCSLVHEAPKPWIPGYEVMSVHMESFTSHTADLNEDKHI